MFLLLLLLFEDKQLNLGKNRALWRNSDHSTVTLESSSSHPPVHLRATRGSIAELALMKASFSENCPRMTCPEVVWKTAPTRLSVTDLT